MPLARDSAICVRLVPFSETSQVVTLLTREHGVLRLMVKGAHRRTKAGAAKFDGGLDLLDLGCGVFSAATEKSLGLLTEWKLLDGHLRLRRSLRAVHLAMLVAEVIPLLLQEHDPHPALYDRVVATLQALGTDATEESIVAFLLDALEETGFLPELSSCLACGTPLAEHARAFFVANRGGVLCADCAESVPGRVPIDPRLLRLAQVILGLPREQAQVLRLPRLAQVQSEPLLRVLLLHLEHVLQRPLRLRTLVVPGCQATSSGNRA